VSAARNEATKVRNRNFFLFVELSPPNKIGACGHKCEPSRLH
jgi:hypothetical protein